MCNNQTGKSHNHTYSNKDSSMCYCLSWACWHYNYHHQEAILLRYNSRDCLSQTNYCVENTMSRNSTRENHNLTSLSCSDLVYSCEPREYHHRSHCYTRDQVHWISARAHHLNSSYSNKEGLYYGVAWTYNHHNHTKDRDNMCYHLTRTCGDLTNQCDYIRLHLHQARVPDYPGYCSYWFEVYGN